MAECRHGLGVAELGAQRIWASVLQQMKKWKHFLLFLEDSDLMREDHQSAKKKRKEIKYFSVQLKEGCLVHLEFRLEAGRSLRQHSR